MCLCVRKERARFFLPLFKLATKRILQIFFFLPTKRNRLYSNASTAEYLHFASHIWHFGSNCVSCGLYFGMKSFIRSQLSTLCNGFFQSTTSRYKRAATTINACLLRVILFLLASFCCCSILLLLSMTLGTGFFRHMKVVPPSFIF